MCATLSPNFSSRFGAAPRWLRSYGGQVVYLLLDDDAAIDAAAEALIADNAPLYRGLIEGLVPGGGDGSKAPPHSEAVIGAVISRALELRMSRWWLTETLRPARFVSGALNALVAMARGAV